MARSFELQRRVQRGLSVLFQGSACDYIGEPVSQLEHALQCAARAQAVAAPPTEVLAALFHDVGHLIAPPGSANMDGLGIVDHEHLGARFLASLGFDEVVCALVASHVQAKRYLAKRKAGYQARLSEASLGTLRFQGGAMSEAEALAFEADPLAGAKIRLRMWDEAAKERDATVPALETYADVIRRHLEERT
jgi:2-amino-1-hydroxyethylphosphonate dioxygenase (glycine-forming)